MVSILSGIVKAHNLSGHYEYSNFSNKLIRGSMVGTAVEYRDGRLVGLVNDRDEGGEVDMPKHVLGLIHTNRMSLLKLSCDDTLYLIGWEMLKDGENNYSGAWRQAYDSMEFLEFLDTKVRTEGLQSFADFPLGVFKPFNPKYFGQIRETGLEVGQRVSLTLSPRDIDLTRRELGL